MTNAPDQGSQVRRWSDPQPASGPAGLAANQPASEAEQRGARRSIADPFASAAKQASGDNVHVWAALAVILICAVMALLLVLWVLWGMLS
jgi:cytochrome c-type biogenesis protein CcmH/NrfG